METCWALFLFLWQGLEFAWTERRGDCAEKKIRGLGKSVFGSRNLEPKLKRTVGGGIRQ
jgi:hypothetical protein